MEEISLHVLDIVENSLSASATLIKVIVDENTALDVLSIVIEDNGKGMSKEFLSKVTNPFVTTRTTRNVGLGIPLFMQGAKQAGGDFIINSELGKGTRICATYKLSHIDRPPIGDMSGTIQALVICNPDIDFEYIRKYDENEFVLDTRKLREVLGSEVPLNSPMVQEWIREYLHEGEDELFGGV